MQENKSFNPTGITNIGDPFVLHSSDGNYYVYATSFETANKTQGFNVWVSNDMRQFSKPIQCYEKNERSFGKEDFWAPEVIEQNGKYIMHYSARWTKNNSLRIGVAISSSPCGPFIDVYDKMPMFDFGYAVIDGHVFIDDNGCRYFYYSRDCSENIYNGYNESHIYVAKISKDFLSIKDEQFLMSPTLDYERKFDGKFAWNEGIFVIKRNKKYYMFYSANFFASKDYCTCVAVSDFPDKDFIKYPAPIISYVEGKISGPGHNCVVDIDGQEYIVYHVHTSYDNPSQDRQMFLDKLILDKDKIITIIPTIKE